MNSSCARSIPNRRKNRFPAGKFLIIGVLLMLTMLTFFSCNRDRPDNLIDEDTYIDLLVEIHLLNAFNDHYDDSHKTLDVQQQLLAEYDITIEQFDASHNWYMQDVDSQRERLDEARSRLSSEITYFGERMMELREKQIEEDEDADEEDIEELEELEQELEDFDEPEIQED